MDITINYLAVFVAGLVSFGIGWVWYSPSVFGTLWMQGGRMDTAMMEASKKKMPLMAGAAFIAQLIAAYVIAHFLPLLGIMDVTGALQFAFWVWLGLTAVPMLGMVLWEMKSLGYYAITAGYWLIGFGVISSILVLWA